MKPVVSRAACIAAALLLSISLGTPAAASTDFKVLFDTDHSASTGCSVSGMAGVEIVLTTTVVPSGAAPHVSAVTLQRCSDGVLGAPTGLDAAGWPAPMNSGTGISTIETSVPFSFFGDPVPTSMRIGFVATDGTQTATIFSDAGGNPLLFPLTPVKRRSVNTPGRTFTLDGQTGDWGSMSPLAYGESEDGTQLLRILAVFAASDTDAFYFRFDAQSAAGAPTAHDDSYSTPVATPLNVAASGVLSNDTDPNHLPLSATLVDTVVRGTLLLNADGSFTYTPVGSAPLRDEFRYRASNGSQPSNVARVEINVGRANQAPVANDDAYTVQLGATLTVAAPGVLSNDTDADGDALRAVLRSGPAHGTLTLGSDGSFTYVNDGRSAASDRFTYVANDGQDDSREATVVIDVNDHVDVPPRANDDRYSVDEGGTLAVPAPGPLVNDNDPDSRLLTMIIVTPPAHGTLTAQANGSFTYGHDGSETTSDSFMYRVSDGQAVSNLATVTITINPVNDAPVAVGDTYTTLEDQTLAVATGTGVLANDTDPDSPHASLTASLVTGPANGTLTLNANGSFQYAPNANFFGNDSFTYRTSDGSLQSAPAAVTIVVMPVNDAPSFTAGPNVTVLEDSAPFSALWATALNAGPNETQNLTFVVSNNKNALFSAQPVVSSTGVLTFTPAPNANGIATVTVQIHDDGGTTNGGVDTSASQTFTITITAVNDAPSFTKGPDEVAVDTAGNQSFIDWATNLSAGPANEAGQALSFIVSNDNNALFSVQPSVASNGTLTFTPIAGKSGVANVTAQIHDDGGTANGGVDTSTPQTFVITINQAPSITSANSATFTAGQPVTFTIVATGYPVPSISESSPLPAGITFTDNHDGTATLSGVPTVTGTFSLALTATNGIGAAATQTLTLTLVCPAINVTNPVSNAFVAGSPMTQTFAQSGGIGATIFSLASGAIPAGLTLDPSGVLAGTPLATGTFPIIVRATDANGCSGTGATYNLTLSCPAIVVTNPAVASAVAGTSFSQTFAQSGGIGVTNFSLASGTLPSGLTLASDGTLSGTPAQTGSFTISVAATDANGCSGVSAPYTLAVSCPTITVTAPAAVIEPAGNAFPQPFTQSGAVGTATFTLAAGTLPAGLTLQTNGALSGTPTVAGAYPVTVQVTDANNCTGSVSTTLTITPGPATQLQFTTQPSNTTAGQHIAPAVTVAIEDTFGNVVDTASGNITIALAANPGGGTLSGTTTVAAPSGVATFTDLSIDKAATGYTLSASSSSLTGATSNAFAITADVPASLIFSGQPASAAAGNAIAPPVGVTILDAFGNVVTAAASNVTVAIANNAGGGLLSGTTTVAASGGVATFANLSINRSGTGYTLSANAPGVTGATSNAFNISPNAPVSLGFTTQPSSSTAGVTIAPPVAVTIFDAFGNVVTTATNSVTIAIASNAVGATLSGTATVAASAGVAVFADLSIDRSGTGYTLSASATGLIAGTSNAFDIVAGPITHFLVESAAGGNIPQQTAAVPFNIRITAQDSFGNAADSFNGTAVLSSSGTLSSATTTAAFTAGVLSSQSVTITSTGTTTITATRTGGTETGTSVPFLVDAGPLDHFVVEAAGGGPIGTQTAGTPFAIDVTAKDASGNTVTAFTGTADLTSNRAGSAGLTTSAAFTAGVLLNHQVTLTETGGLSTITATHTGGSETGTSNNFTVNPGALAGFVVEAAGGGLISTQAAGVPFNIGIRAVDSFGNLVPSFNGTVDVSSNRTGSAGLTTSGSFTAGVLVSHSVTLTQSGSGSTITATRTAGTETGTSAMFTVNAAALQNFTVEAAGGGIISTQTAGVPFNVAISARDQFNNIVTAFNGTVDVTSNRAGTAGLTTSAGFTAGVLPSHSITLTQTGPGSTITATRTSGSETGTSNGFTVTSGALAGFVVEAAGGGAIVTQTAGVPFNIDIRAVDSFGNVVTSFNGTADVTSNRTGSSGLTTSAAFTAGVLASHSITLTQAGAGSTITATRTAGTETGTSNNFTVNPNVLQHFKVEGAGGGAIPSQTAGVPFNVSISARDQFNNLVTSFTGTVNVTSNRAGSAGLTTSASFTAGVLLSHTVALTQSGGGATVTATLTAGTETGSSNSFTVNAAALQAFTVEAQGGGAISTQTAGVPFNVTITARDQFSNVVTAFNGTVDVTSNRIGSVGLTTSASFTAGVLASHTITLTLSGTGANITATRTAGIETGSSNNFTVNAGPLQSFLVEAAGGGFIGTQTAGAPFNVGITARDQFNNTVTTFNGTVSVTSNRTGTSGLTTTAAFTAGVLASHTLTLTQSGPGAAITATRTAGTETGTSNFFTVNPGVLTGFNVEAAAGGPIPLQLPNTPFTIRITAHDASNNTVTSFTGTVDISSTGTLTAGSGTSAPFIAGVLSPSVTISSSGTATITATRTAGTETGTSNAFIVDTPPSVSSTTPANNATNVAITTTVTITFNESVNATTSSFAIKCPSTGPALSYALSASPATTFTLTPSASLPGGATCQVTALAAQVTNSNGTHMTADNSFSFTTAVVPIDDTFPAIVTGNVSFDSSNMVIPFSVLDNDGVAAASVLNITVNSTQGANRTDNGGTIVMTASGPNAGRLIYDPPAGFTGTDHFTYAITTSAGTSSSANVSITVSGMVWFIDNQASACSTQCGRLSQPFTTLAAFQAVNDGVGTHPNNNQNIFLYESPTSYTGPATLRPGQRLIGQDATASLSSISGITLAAGSASFPAMNTAGNATTINGASGGVILPATGTVSIHGLTIATTGGAGVTSPIAGTFGTLNFSNAPGETADAIISVTGGSALDLTSGTVGGTLANASASGGVNALNFNAVLGSLTINGGALSGNAAGPTVNVTGGNATITYKGSVTEISANRLAAITNRTGGTFDLQGTLSCTAACTGISVASNTAGTASFSGTTKTLSPAAGDAVTISGNLAPVAVQFINGGLAITTSTANGITYTGAGSVTLSGASNSITTTSGAAISHGGTGTITSSTGMTINTTTGRGVSFTGVGTMTLSGSGHTITTSAGGTPIFGSSFGTLNVDGTTLNATGGPALDLTTGTVSIGQTSTVNAQSSNSATRGMNFTTIHGAASIQGVAGNGIAGSTGTALNITGAGSDAAISYAGPVSKTSSGTLVIVQNHSSSSAIVVSGALSCTLSCLGMNVSNNTGGTISFSNASKTLNTSANTAVTLSSNTGATINFTNGGLGITTTTGNGFDATAGGTVNVTGTGNKITSAGGIALNVQNTNSGGLTFESISSSGGSNGIRMMSAGTGGLTVTGTGGRCDTGLSTCTGGTINGTTGADGATDGVGVYLSNTSNVSLTAMHIAGTHQNFGIYGTSVGGLTLDTVLLDGTYGNTGANEGAADFDELSGTVSVKNSYFAGGAVNNFRIHNTAGTLNPITFDTDTFGFTSATGSNGLQVVIDGGTTNVTVQSSTFLGAFAVNLQFLINGGGSTIVVQDNSFANTQPVTSSTFYNFQLIADGTNATTGTIKYTLARNTLIQSKQAAIYIAKRHGQWLLDGTIDTNVIGTSAAGPDSGSSSGEGIRIEHISQGKHRMLIEGNTVTRYNNIAGISVRFVGNSTGAPSNGSMHLTAKNNTVTTPGSTTSFLDSIHIDPGGAGSNDQYTMCADLGFFGSNNLAGGVKDQTGTPGAPYSIGPSTVTTGVAVFLKILNLGGGPYSGNSAIVPIDTIWRAQNNVGAAASFIDLSSAVTTASSSALVGTTCDLP